MSRNRYKELTPKERESVDALINALASRARVRVGDPVLRAIDAIAELVDR